MKERKRFVYKRPDEKTVLERGTRKGGGQYDNPFKSEIPVFLASKDGEYRIRILPSTWEGAQGYGYDCYIHYGVGADNGRFICPKNQTKGEACPVCEERDKAKRAGDEKYAQNLKAAFRIAAWIIDRNNEKAGPQLFPIPFTLDKAIGKKSVKRKTGEVLYVDDPENGHDIEFTRETEGKKTTYDTNVEVDSDPTPISDDERKQDRWLEYIQEHPIPDCLEIHDYDYIADVFKGKGKPKDDEDEDERPARTRSDDRRSKSDDDEDESPRSRRQRQEDEDDEPKPKRRQKIDDEDEPLDEDRPARRKPRDEEEDDEPPRRKRVQDEDDEPKPRRRAQLDDEDEDRQPLRRRRPVEDDEEPPRRKRVRDEED